jgi:hypothetical protein
LHNFSLPFSFGATCWNCFVLIIVDRIETLLSDKNVLLSVIYNFKSKYCICVNFITFHNGLDENSRNFYEKSVGKINHNVHSIENQDWNSRKKSVCEWKIKCHEKMVLFLCSVENFSHSFNWVEMRKRISNRMENNFS